jgi:alanyl-tRNA synthetase
MHNIIYFCDKITLNDMKSAEVRQKYLEFFKKHGHTEIPSARLVPENDPTTLFNSSGMQPLVPYLLGQPHPVGKRLVNSQKAIRLQDIDEVGDNRHTTFFEMLGNWSLGDYFKNEQLLWVFEFLTSELHLDPKRLFVSVFEGDSTVPKDDESITIWQEIFRKSGIDAQVGERIFLYPAQKNWWSRSGEPEKMPPGEPGGPDSEIFYDFGPELKMHEHSPFVYEPCHPNCNCGRFMEIGNSVFMQYQKQADGELIEMAQKNVDFGGGLERITAATEGAPDVYKTDLFTLIIRTLEVLSKRHYGDNDKETRAMRIVSDHIRGSIMLIADGVLPANKQQGYVLRRLIRRSLLYGRDLGLTQDWKYVGLLVEPTAKIFSTAYPEVTDKNREIKQILEDEALRFGKTLEKGLREIEKLEQIDGAIAFKLYETYGFPWEMTEEIARNKGQHPDRKQFESEFKKHQELSRTAAAGMFKGGLQDHSVETTKLHTATHLLHQALRMVLGDHVGQKGSNITVERLRFDFSHPTKMTDTELAEVEQIVNEQIQKDLPVSFIVTTYTEAVKNGSLAFFGQRYPEKVKVYTIGDANGKYFSREVCGGPHVEHTGLLGNFKILKEESAAAGIRRIYASVSS